MTFHEFISAQRSHSKMPLHDSHKSHVEACLAVQIHTTGARPAYMGSTGWVEPETYNKKYEKLFKDRLLNRHPNENPSHYNWRLSIYSPVAKEIYDKFLNLCQGSILQPNNYSVRTESEALNTWVDNELGSLLKDTLSFVLQNPYGYLVAMTDGEYSSNELPRVKLALVSPENVLMYDKQSIAFKYSGKTIYIDSEYQYTILDGEAIEAPHKMGIVPIVFYQNSFLQPYQFWADSLVRNMNDDEAMVKHYSYPIVQIVEQECNTCHGTCTMPNPLYDTLSNPTVDPKCKCTVCDGRGTISRNPGDFVTISEETVARNGGQIFDVAKFHTPDIGIPEYHLNRWKTFYEFCSNSLHLKPITEGVQSGEGKKEDRKDQYYFLQSVSNYVFNLLADGLRFIGHYLSNGKDVPIYMVQPKQFDLMSDSDLVNEFAILQGKTDDSQTLSELGYVVNQKVFRDDKTQLKINEVLYLADTLYGVSGNALKSKLLSGVYTALDKVIHEKGYKILVNYAQEITPAVFTEMETRVIINELTIRCQAMIPQGIYDGFDN